MKTHRLIADEAGLERNASLKPPRNFRAVNLPHLCVNCALLLTESLDDRGDVTYCTRPGGPVYETGMLEEWFNVCDNWQGF